MVGSKIRTRRVGALAVLGRDGKPVVTSDAGGSLDVAVGVTAPGFSPVDLLCAALAACLVMSVRIAAAGKGMAGLLDEVRVHVAGEKAADGRSRLARFHVRFDIRGTVDAAGRNDLIAAAEEICTVSNTLRGDAEIVVAHE